MSNTDSTSGNQTRKRGNRLGFLFFKTSLRIFGLRGAYGLLYFVCLYYLVFDRKAVHLGMVYIKRRFPGKGLFPRLVCVYKLFISQGKNLIDRYYIVLGLGSFDIQLKDYDKIEDLLNKREQGFILLMAHVGNWQVVMNSLHRFSRRIFLLMRPEDNEAVKESLKVGDENDAVGIISPEGFLGGIIEMTETIQSGHIVSIMGDRSYGHNSIEVDFLGGTAGFPLSAFSIAAAAECPVVVLLSAKISTKKYVVDVAQVFNPVYRKGVKRKIRLKGEVQDFAKILEEYTQKFPFQFFLFSDIWKEKDETDE